jgi:hypothetical protein
MLHGVYEQRPQHLFESRYYAEGAVFAFLGIVTFGLLLTVLALLDPFHLTKIQLAFWAVGAVMGLAGRIMVKEGLLGPFGKPLYGILKRYGTAPDYRFVDLLVPITKEFGRQMLIKWYSFWLENRWFPESTREHFKRQLLTSRLGTVEREIAEIKAKEFFMAKAGPADAIELGARWVWNKIERMFRQRGVIVMSSLAAMVLTASGYLVPGSIVSGMLGFFGVSVEFSFALGLLSDASLIIGILAVFWALAVVPLERSSERRSILYQGVNIPQKTFVAFAMGLLFMIPLSLLPWTPLVHISVTVTWVIVGVVVTLLGGRVVENIAPFAGFLISRPFAWAGSKLFGGSPTLGRWGRQEQAQADQLVQGVVNDLFPSGMTRPRVSFSSLETKGQNLWVVGRPAQGGFEMGRILFDGTVRARIQEERMRTQPPQNQAEMQALLAQVARETLLVQMSRIAEQCILFQRMNHPDAAQRWGAVLTADQKNELARLVNAYLRTKAFAGETPQPMLSSEQAVGLSPQLRIALVTPMIPKGGLMEYVTGIFLPGYAGIVNQGRADITVFGHQDWTEMDRVPLELTPVLDKVRAANALGEGVVEINVGDVQSGDRALSELVRDLDIYAPRFPNLTIILRNQDGEQLYRSDHQADLGTQSMSVAVRNVSARRSRIDFSRQPQALWDDVSAELRRQGAEDTAVSPAAVRDFVVVIPESWLSNPAQLREIQGYCAAFESRHRAGALYHKSLRVVVHRPSGLPRYDFYNSQKAPGLRDAALGAWANDRQGRSNLVLDLSQKSGGMEETLARYASNLDAVREGTDPNATGLVLVIPRRWLEGADLPPAVLDNFIRRFNLNNARDGAYVRGLRIIVENNDAAGSRELFYTNQAASGEFAYVQDRFVEYRPVQEVSGVRTPGPAKIAPVRIARPTIYNQSRTLTKLVRAVEGFDVVHGQVHPHSSFTQGGGPGILGPYIPKAIQMSGETGGVSMAVHQLYNDYSYGHATRTDAGPRVTAGRASNPVQEMMQFLGETGAERSLFGMDVAVMDARQQQALERDYGMQNVRVMRHGAFPSRPLNPARFTVEGTKFVGRIGYMAQEDHVMDGVQVPVGVKRAEDQIDAIKTAWQEVQNSPAARKPRVLGIIGGPGAYNSVLTGRLGFQSPGVWGDPEVLILSQTEVEQALAGFTTPAQYQAWIESRVAAEEQTRRTALNDPNLTIKVVYRPGYISAREHDWIIGDLLSVSLDLRSVGQGVMETGYVAASHALPIVTSDTPDARALRALMTENAGQPSERTGVALVPTFGEGYDTVPDSRQAGRVVADILLNYDTRGIQMADTNLNQANQEQPEDIAEAYHASFLNMLGISDSFSMWDGRAPPVGSASAMEASRRVAIEAPTPSPKVLKRTLDSLSSAFRQVVSWFPSLFNFDSRTVQGRSNRVVVPIMLTLLGALFLGLIGVYDLSGTLGAFSRIVLDLMGTGTWAALGSLALSGAIIFGFSEIAKRYTQDGRVPFWPVLTMTVFGLMAGVFFGLINIGLVTMLSDFQGWHIIVVRVVIAGLFGLFIASQDRFVSMFLGRNQRNSHRVWGDLFAVSMVFWPIALFFIQNSGITGQAMGLAQLACTLIFALISLHLTSRNEPYNFLRRLTSLLSRVTSAVLPLVNLAGYRYQKYSPLGYERLADNVRDTVAFGTPKPNLEVPTPYDRQKSSRIAKMISGVWRLVMGHPVLIRFVYRAILYNRWLPASLRQTALEALENDWRLSDSEQVSREMREVLRMQALEFGQKSPLDFVMQTLAMMVNVFYQILDFGRRLVTQFLGSLRRLVVFSWNKMLYPFATYLKDAALDVGHSIRYRWFPWIFSWEFGGRLPWLLLPEMANLTLSLFGYDAVAFANWIRFLFLFLPGIQRVPDAVKFVLNIVIQVGATSAFWTHDAATALSRLLTNFRKFLKNALTNIRVWSVLSGFAGIIFSYYVGHRMEAYSSVAEFFKLSLAPGVPGMILEVIVFVTLTLIWIAALRGWFGKGTERSQDTWMFAHRFVTTFFMGSFFLSAYYFFIHAAGIDPASAIAGVSLVASILVSVWLTGMAGVADIRFHIIVIGTLFWRWLNRPIFWTQNQERRPMALVLAALAALSLGGGALSGMFVLSGAGMVGVIYWGIIGIGSVALLRLILGTMAASRIVSARKREAAQRWDELGALEQKLGASPSMQRGGFITAQLVGRAQGIIQRLQTGQFTDENGLNRFGLPAYESIRSEPNIRLDVLDDVESGKQMARVDGNYIVINIRHLVPLLKEIDDLQDKANQVLPAGAPTEAVQARENARNRILKLESILEGVIAEQVLMRHWQFWFERMANGTGDFVREEVDFDLLRETLASETARMNPLLWAAMGTLGTIPAATLSPTDMLRGINDIMNGTDLALRLRAEIRQQVVDGSIELGEIERDTLERLWSGKSVSRDELRRLNRQLLQFVYPEVFRNSLSPEMEILFRERLRKEINVQGNRVLEARASGFVKGAGEAGAPKLWPVLPLSLGLHVVAPTAMAPDGGLDEYMRTMVFPGYAPVYEAGQIKYNPLAHENWKNEDMMLFTNHLLGGWRGDTVPQAVTLPGAALAGMPALRGQVTLKRKLKKADMTADESALQASLDPKFAEKGPKEDIVFAHPIQKTVVDLRNLPAGKELKVADFYAGERGPQAPWEVLVLRVSRTQWWEGRLILPQHVQNLIDEARKKNIYIAIVTEEDQKTYFINKDRGYQAFVYDSVDPNVPGTLLAPQGQDGEWQARTAGLAVPMSRFLQSFTFVDGLKNKVTPQIKAERGTITLGGTVRNKVVIDLVQLAAGQEMSFDMLSQEPVIGYRDFVNPDGIRAAIAGSAGLQAALGVQVNAADPGLANLDLLKTFRAAQDDQNLFSKVDAAVLDPIIAANADFRRILEAHRRLRAANAKLDSAQMRALRALNRFILEGMLGDALLRKDPELSQLDRLVPMIQAGDVVFLKVSYAWTKVQQEQGRLKELIQRCADVGAELKIVTAPEDLKTHSIMEEVNTKYSEKSLNPDQIDQFDIEAPTAIDVREGPKMGMKSVVFRVTRFDRAQPMSRMIQAAKELSPDAAMANLLLVTYMSGARPVAAIAPFGIRVLANVLGKVTFAVMHHSGIYMHKKGELEPGGKAPSLLALFKVVLGSMGLELSYKSNNVFVLMMFKSFRDAYNKHYKIRAEQDVHGVFDMDAFRPERFNPWLRKVKYYDEELADKLARRVPLNDTDRAKLKAFLSGKPKLGQLYIIGGGGKNEERLTEIKGEEATEGYKQIGIQEEACRASVLQLDARVLKETEINDNDFQDVDGLRALIAANAEVRQALNLPGNVNVATLNLIETFQKVRDDPDLFTRVRPDLLQEDKEDDYFRELLRRHAALHGDATRETSKRRLGNNRELRVLNRALLEALISDPKMLRRANNLKLRTVGVVAGGDNPNAKGGTQRRIDQWKTDPNVLIIMENEVEEATRKGLINKENADSYPRWIEARVNEANDKGMTVKTVYRPFFIPDDEWFLLNRTVYSILMQVYHTDTGTSGPLHTAAGFWVPVVASEAPAFVDARKFFTAEIGGKSVSGVSVSRMVGEGRERGPDMADMANNTEDILWNYDTRGMEMGLAMGLQADRYMPHVVSNQYDNLLRRRLGWSRFGSTFWDGRKNDRADRDAAEGSPDNRDTAVQMAQKRDHVTDLRAQAAEVMLQTERPDRAPQVSEQTTSTTGTAPVTPTGSPLSAFWSAYSGIILVGITVAFGYFVQLDGGVFYALATVSGWTVLKTVMLLGRKRAAGEYRYDSETKRMEVYVAPYLGSPLRNVTEAHERMHAALDLVLLGIPGFLAVRSQSPPANRFARAFFKVADFVVNRLILEPITAALDMLFVPATFVVTGNQTPFQRFKSVRNIALLYAALGWGLYLINLSWQFVDLGGVLATVQFMVEQHGLLSAVIVGALVFAAIDAVGQFFFGRFYLVKRDISKTVVGAAVPSQAEGLRLMKERTAYLDSLVNRVSAEDLRKIARMPVDRMAWASGIRDLILRYQRENGELYGLEQLQSILSNTALQTIPGVDATNINEVSEYADRIYTHFERQHADDDAFMRDLNKKLSDPASAAVFLGDNIHAAIFLSFLKKHVAAGADNAQFMIETGLVDPAFTARIRALITQLLASNSGIVDVPTLQASASRTR